MASPASCPSAENPRVKRSNRRDGAGTAMDGGGSGVRSIQTSHGRIAFCTTEGVRTPLVLLHGRSRCKTEFRRLMATSVGEERMMIAIDLPGHGGSGAPSDPDHTYTIEGYADAEIEVLEHLGIERAGVLGRSLGGHVGLQMACAFPGFAGLFVDRDERALGPFQPDLRAAPSCNPRKGRGAPWRTHGRRTNLPTEDDALEPVLRLVSRSDDRYRHLSHLDPAPTAGDLATMRHAIGGGRPFMRSLHEHPYRVAATGDVGNEGAFQSPSKALLRFLSHLDRVSPSFPLHGLCLSG